MPRIKDPNAPTLIRACLSLDDPTLTLLEKIRHKFHLSKANASKMIVGGGISLTTMAFCRFRLVRPHLVRHCSSTVASSSR